MKKMMKAGAELGPMQERIRFPKFEIPTKEELQQKPLEDLYAQWKSNHQELIMFLEQNRSRIQPFGLHGAAKEDLRRLRTSSTGDILIASYLAPVSAQDLSAALYIVASYALSYAYLTQRVREQGIGGIMLVKRARFQDGNVFTAVTGTLKTGSLFGEMGFDEDEPEIQALYERIEANYDQVPEQERAVEIAIDFSREAGNMIASQHLPIPLYGSRNIEDFILDPGSDFKPDHRARSILARRFLMQDVLLAALKKVTI